MNRTSFCGQFFRISFHLAAPRNRQIHATGLAVDMAELQTRLADGRIVHNREKARRVRHYRSIEERFVMVEQIDQVYVALDGLCPSCSSLQHDPLQLDFIGLRYTRNEPNKPECLFFRLQ